jgi:hypothetical protein
LCKLHPGHGHTALEEEASGGFCPFKLPAARILRQKLARLPCEFQAESDDVVVEQSGQMINSAWFSTRFEKKETEKSIILRGYPNFLMGN